MPGVSIGGIGNPPTTAPAASIPDVIEPAGEAVPATAPSEKVTQPAKDEAHVPSVSKSRKAGKQWP